LNAHSRSPILFRTVDCCVVLLRVEAPKRSPFTCPAVLGSHCALIRCGNRPLLRQQGSGKDQSTNRTLTFVEPFWSCDQISQDFRMVSLTTSTPLRHLAL